MTLPEPGAREEALYERRRALGIAWKTIQHVPVFTTEEAAAVSGTLTGALTKNLFLKDQKGGLWLVVLRDHIRLDLKALAKALPCPRFSFGSAELLIETLGIAPGAVTPFALMNDGGAKVKVILDAGMMAMDPLNFHPLRNDRTATISAEALLKFIRATGHEPIIAAMPEKAG